MLSSIDVTNVARQVLTFDCGEELGLSESELLSRVQKLTSKAYRRAVETCFDYATAPICDVTTAADIMALAGKVLVPLVGWKKSVVDVRNTAAITPLWYTDNQLRAQAAKNA